jgi:hypothetical protein
MATPSLEDILAVDHWAREAVTAIVAGLDRRATVLA